MMPPLPEPTPAVPPPELEAVPVLTPLAVAEPLPLGDPVLPPVDPGLPLVDPGLPPVVPEPLPLVIPALTLPVWPEPLSPLEPDPRLTPEPASLP
jgi:hypothetical protein